MAVESGEQAVDADGGSRVIGSLDVGRMPGGVVDHEVHVGELAGDGHDVVGMIEDGIEVDKGKSLVGHEDLHSQIVCMLHCRSPMVGSSSEKPWAVGLQAVYTLKAAGGPDCTALDISSRWPRGARRWGR